MSNSQGSQPTTDGYPVELTPLSALHVDTIRCYTHIISVMHNIYFICIFKIYMDTKKLFIQPFMLKV